MRVAVRNPNCDYLCVGSGAMKNKDLIPLKELVEYLVRGHQVKVRWTLRIMSVEIIVLAVVVILISIKVLLR